MKLVVVGPVYPFRGGIAHYILGAPDGIEIGEVRLRHEPQRLAFAQPRRDRAAVRGQSTEVDDDGFGSRPGERTRELAGEVE